MHILCNCMKRRSVPNNKYMSYVTYHITVFPFKLIHPQFLFRPLQLSYQNADMSMVPKVVDMLMCNFLYDEPINQALKLHTEKFFLEDFVVAGMAEGLTMVAMDNETGKILGKNS